MRNKTKILNSEKISIEGDSTHRFVLERSGIKPVDANGKLQFADYDYVETWKALEKVYEKGLARNIGVSNFNEEQLERVLKEGKIKPVTNQVECQPYLTQIKLSEYCKSKGIAITAYCPLGSPDRSWAKPEDPKLLDDQKITSIAKKYDKTPAQVVLRYQVTNLTDNWLCVQNGL